MTLFTGHSNDKPVSSLTFPLPSDWWMLLLTCVLTPGLSLHPLHFSHTIVLMVSRFFYHQPVLCSFTRATSWNSEVIMSLDPKSFGTEGPHCCQRPSFYHSRGAESIMALDFHIFTHSVFSVRMKVIY